MKCMRKSLTPYIFPRIRKLIITIIIIIIIIIHLSRFRFVKTDPQKFCSFFYIGCGL